MGVNQIIYEKKNNESNSITLRNVMVTNFNQLYHRGKTKRAKLSVKNQILQKKMTQSKKPRYFVIAVMTN